MALSRLTSITIESHFPATVGIIFGYPTACFSSGNKNMLILTGGKRNPTESIGFFATPNVGVLIADSPSNVLGTDSYGARPFRYIYAFFR